MTYSHFSALYASCSGSPVGLRPRSDFVPVPGHVKGTDCREIGGTFGVGASTPCKKVNTAGTDENLFKLVGSIRVSGHPDPIPDCLQVPVNNPYPGHYIDINMPLLLLERTSPIFPPGTTFFQALFTTPKVAA